MMLQEIVLSAFLGFTLGIIAIFQIKAVRDTFKEAKSLTKVLTTNQNIKGQFGEDCLEAILKVCYPENNINYKKQFLTKNENGIDIKPDYVVNLPNDKSILIDCKLNLQKYIDYANNPSDVRKNLFIKDINATINSLSNKKYETAQNIKQPDFILMYIPLEAIVTQIYTDSDFLNVVRNANDKNIIIVGNSSILTVIRLTKLLWAQDAQNKNVDNIVSISENLYDIIAQHSNILHEIKKTLIENNERFNKEYERLTSSKLFNYIEKLKNYGIEAKEHKIGRKNKEINIHSDFLNN